MMRKLLLPGAIAALLCLGGPAHAAEGVELPHQSWSFNSLFGTYDRAELQRGYEVYRNVCANCHSLRLLSYRNLEGIGLGPDEIKEIAAAVTVTDGPNDEGEMFERPGLPSDRFVSPFPNEQAARASNNGAYPVDLSLVAKARIGGPDYLYALMTGYVDPPAEFKLGDGMNYNKYFGAGGFQIGAIAPGSIFQRIGLQNADTLRAVNGIELTSPERVLEAYTKLRGASHISVRLERRGAPLTLDYQIRG